MATAKGNEVKRIEVTTIDGSVVFHGRGQNLISNGEYSFELKFCTHEINGADNKKQVPVIYLEGTDQVIYLSALFKDKYAVAYNNGQLEESVIENRGTLVEVVRQETDGKTAEELKKLFKNSSKFKGKKIKVSLASYRGYDYFGQVKMLQYNIFDLV